MISFQKVEMQELKIRFMITFKWPTKINTYAKFLEKRLM